MIADMFEIEDDLGLKKTIVTADVCQNELKKTESEVKSKIGSTNPEEEGSCPC